MALGVKFKRKSYIDQCEDPYDYYDPIKEGGVIETEDYYIIEGEGTYPNHGIPKDDVIEYEYYNAD